MLFVYYYIVKVIGVVLVINFLRIIWNIYDNNKFKSEFKIINFNFVK